MSYKRYEITLPIRFYVDVEDTVENAEFFRKLKETLKARFKQIDIWIVSYEIGLT